VASVGDTGARWGMLVVETIAKIGRAYFAQNKPIKTICREFRVSRRVVRKVIRSQATEFRYERSRQPRPRIDPWRDQLDGLLLENERAHAAGTGSLLTLRWRKPSRPTSVRPLVPLPRRFSGACCASPALRHRSPVWADCCASAEDRPKLYGLVVTIGGSDDQGSAP
jgi:hypothetical protein